MLCYLPGGPSPWQTYTPHASKANLLGNIPWVFRGLCPCPGSGYPSLQESWCSARGLGPTNRHPAAAGCWLLSGHVATPHEGEHYGNLGLCCPSTQWSLPPPRRVPPRCHHQPCRSMTGAAQKRGEAGVTARRTLSLTVPSLLQPRAPFWAKSCLWLGAMLWMPELEQLCVWQWCILIPQG